MAGKMAFQLIELMPREKWNQPVVHDVDRMKKTAEELLGFAMENMVDKEFPENKNEEEEYEDVTGEDQSSAESSSTSSCSEVDDESRGGFPQVNSPSWKIEHVRTDDIDLSVFSPRPWYNEALIDMLRTCYSHHCPIALSPDLIYGHLAKGIAKHVAKFPEELRHLFVQHKGKKTLKYKNNTYVMGKKENDWALAFKSFADQLKDATKPNSVVQNELHFSTSSALNEAHRHVLSMESMQHYFEYRCCTLCGISAIILEGTEADWNLLKEVIIRQVTEINDYCKKNPETEAASLAWWSTHVIDMLQKMYDSYDMQKAGKLSSELEDWWKTMYKWNGDLGSGPPTASGWINILFPYLANGKRNPWTVRQTAEIEPEDYPSYSSSVPFIWEYDDTEYKMRAIIGHCIPAQVSASSKAAIYPQGTMKIFPAWAIVYE